MVCSTSGDNGGENQRKLGKDYPIGQPSDPVKKISFYTSTCFEGCDLRRETALHSSSAMVINPTRCWIFQNLVYSQICGRLRDSKYKAKLHVIPRPSTAEMLHWMNMWHRQRKTLAEAVRLCHEINSLSETARKKTLSKIKYINEQYVRIEDNRLVVDKNLANMDIVNFKICRHIYRTYIKPCR